MTSFHKIVPTIIKAAVFQKVFKKENIGSEETTRAEQVNAQTLLKAKNDFDKAVSEITKYMKCSIPKVNLIRRGDVHAR